jgi:hypothetical protein
MGAIIAVVVVVRRTGGFSVGRRELLVMLQAQRKFFFPVALSIISTWWGWLYTATLHLVGHHIDVCRLRLIALRLFISK